MIVSRLAGGLGNQLFQYATAKALSLRLNKMLVLDVSYYTRNRSRKFELDNFNIQSSISDIPIEDELFFYKEPHFHYDTNFQLLDQSKIYLAGFWQSEKYFKDIKNALIDDLTIRNDLVYHLTPKAEELQYEESVCVHIRRGDYQVGRNLVTHGFVSLEYYYKAIMVLAEMKKGCKFYFFSDDIAWVRKHLKISYPHQFISQGNFVSTIEDFFLMNKCKHSIIANSTFSWWSAWLNLSDSQTVIAPRKWLQGESYNCKDIIPQNWLTL